MTKRESIFMDHDELKTPCYVIYQHKLHENLYAIYTELAKRWDGNVRLGYSFKTNNFPYILDYIKQEGFLAETVSDDEYHLAIQHGFQPDQVIYNGPQKTEQLLIEAINQNSIVNVDNLQDVELIEKNLHRINQNDPVIGLRVNVDLEALCPGETSAENGISRLGLSVESLEFRQAVERLKRAGFSIAGLHMHYSTKTRSVRVFRELSRQACQLIKEYELVDSISYIDIGGGFFKSSDPDVRPTPSEYAACITEELGKILNSSRVQVIIEPGASVIAASVEYVTRVINTRDVRGSRIVTMDGSSLDINPFMAKRMPVFYTSELSDTVEKEQIICGSTCIEGDRFADLHKHRQFKKGDLMIIQNAGAYTMVYNNYFINTPPYVYAKEEDRYYLLRDKVRTGLFVHNQEVR
ncbi:diaminopimelate decarboxylase [Jeotgalibacillus salarius]|uniref:Diaminopimelate decarboxylase n=1 Tax=Jeotgalibacillus salarius TaxID=546023 RepID=A0A4Y8LKI7_9BACL|nr:diaminopimelate decarboxylase [Jeotgalibacillus salarius]TFE01709.1 diaminopimelate decarboxylase [Jeotgalibacillus salarius]